MKTVDWSENLPFSAGEWLPYDSVRVEVSLFSFAGDICVSVHGVLHRNAILYGFSVACSDSYLRAWQFACQK